MATSVIEVKFDPYAKIVILRRNGRFAAQVGGAFMAMTREYDDISDLFDYLEKIFIQGLQVAPECLHELSYDPVLVQVHKED